MDDTEYIDDTEYARPIADGIPVDLAWTDPTQPRRIYVRAAYGSPLTEALLTLKAKWDSDAEARWVGTGKRDALLGLLAEHQAREAARTAGLTDGVDRTLSIPFKAAHIREAAKKAGAEWDPEKKAWKFPTDQSLAEIKAMVDSWDARTGSTTRTNKPPRRKCDQCYERWAVREATDSSGIPGWVCRTCDGPSYELSFA